MFVYGRAACRQYGIGDIMALSASALEQQLISAMRGIDSAQSAITTFGNTIINYITANAQITYSWVGTNPSTGAPDPVTTATAKATGSGSFTIPSDLSNMCQQIAAAIKGLTIVMDDPTFVVSPLQFNPAGTITIVMSQEDSFEAAMRTVASQIISSIPTFISATPAAGSHAAFTGSATMLSIL